jgi:hypothetical protein
VLSSSRIDDNGYARSLESFTDRPDIVQRVVLLEGLPFEKELVPLPYPKHQFPGLFRESKLVLSAAAPAYNYAPQAQTTPGSSSPGLKNYNMFSGLPTRFPAPIRPPGIMNSPLPPRAALAASNMPRTPSSSTLASDGLLQLKLSYAANAAAVPPPVTEYKPMNRDEVISRNRAGQRVDPPSKDYDKAEVERFKKLKLCNMHYLRNECPWLQGCQHIHDAVLTKDEIATLRLVARMAPCSGGSACQDISCIYGHRCPAPPSRTHQPKGSRTCIFGEFCKFPSELHDIDTNVVKTLIIR